MSATNLKLLVAQKDKIEDDIKELYEVLSSQGSGAIDEPLVDSEGYPRSDIDVHQVRIVRNKIACLQNDHKDLMKKIEEGLYDLHSSAKEKVSATTRIEIVDEISAFAHVTVVSKDSPAETAKLKSGDQIVQFGSVTKSNFKSMQNIAEIVRHSEGKNVEVYVLRNEVKTRIVLVPKKWTGNGLLGCSIVPL